MQPPTEKVHQIIARTATFVSKHGGQSEIVLRVKQGDNPTFGFLMPNHHLHPYFRFLVDHQDLLQSDIEGKNEPEDQMGTAAQSSAAGGALSLLGSVYGSGDDDDPAMEGGHDPVNISPEKTINESTKTDSYGLGKGSYGTNDAEKDKLDAKAKHRPTSNKDRVPLLKKNPSIAASKSGTSSDKKQIDESGSFSFPMEKSKGTLMLEPPSDLKRLIDKIVEFIIKNGKQFESTLREQDSNHGRFPFLVPSNQYHPYYLKVLQRAEESKLGPRNSFHGREDFMARNMDKRPLIPKDNDALALGSVGYDLPFESDRKEKFKMVIGKAKKDVNDPPSSKGSQQGYGISVDAAAAAAILQAATRGIRNPDLGIISSVAVNGSSYDRDSVVGRGSNSKRQASSELNEMVQISDQGGECNSSLPIAQTAEGVIIGTAAKEESSEEHLSREQKLKAERLKRAKMFVAKLRTGSGLSTTEPSQTLSEEPIESGALGAGAEVGHTEKVKGGSSTLVDSCIPDETGDTGRKHFGDEYSERRLRRKYRLRSERHEVDDESDNEEEEDVVESPIKKKRRSHRSSQEGKGGKEKDAEEGTQKHSKRKHGPYYSSDEKDYNNDKCREKSHRHSRKRNQSRHHSHEDEDGDTNYHKHSRKKHSSHWSSHEEDDREDYEDEKYHKYSRKKHRSHRNSHKHAKKSPKTRSKHESSDDTDHSHKHRKESHRRRSKHESSSDSDHEHIQKHKKESHKRSKHKRSTEHEHRDVSRYVEHLEKEDLEEGEIGSKFSDQSRGSGTGGGSRETSLDNVSTLPKVSSQPSETTEVSDDLRAKIRAMLMATR